ncbi:PspC domain-containing protein [Nocardioides sp. dk4132]|uniref:ATP-binding protein n=1 Tax=unclassified Nocardioides TaxID=2615069 RepID=UPI001294CDD3|nr:MULTISPECIES: ATP-binding protein [unclassified Nocardioides]MQW75969.1 PspC domain-containing protein [Nocardioides sp. dk4132]QGA08826.1 PspC domain-containing protein [Nocardioides sp. dk884]
MSSPSSTAPPPGAAAPRETRKAYRDTHDVVIGGVASGLAEHLGLPVLTVRVAFLVLALLGFLGVALYAGLWMVLPADNRFPVDAPGLESATRGGRRPGPRRRWTDYGPMIALHTLGFGLVLVAEAIFGRGAIFWPVFLGLVGLALLWRQADEAQRERWRDTSGRVDPLRIVFGGGGWGAVARVASGVSLVVAAALIIGLDGASLADARGAVAGGALVLLGIAVVVGPWVYRLAIDLSAEREERVRNQERADVAAHLHDSVLQTLALIQKNATDSAAVARLARAQERDLRAWLYAEEAQDERTLASALRGAMAEIEDAHGITVDVVTVGDCDLDEQLHPVLAAAREAVTNVAKHAGTGRADVYAEVTDTAVDIFVRDRGCGFDPDRTAPDRYGVRHSIVDRLQRHGGRAEVRSAPGEGTEVRLHLPRPTSTDPSRGDER